MEKKAKKMVAPKVDGLSADDIKKLRNAIRQVWHWSYPRKLCVARCVGSDGFSYCEQCGKRAPKIFIDHIVNAGELDGGYIARMFVPSLGLQGLCKECHAPKTQKERSVSRSKKKKAKLKPITDDDFL